MGLPGMALSAIAGAVGAVIYWTITYESTGFRLSTVGLILMIVGAFGFIVSTIVFVDAQRPSGGSRHSLDRHAVNGDGQTTSVHEVSQ